MYFGSVRLFITEKDLVVLVGSRLEVKNTGAWSCNIQILTLEIPVYEPQFRGSARFVEVRDFSRWEVFFLVPKHIKMVQNT